MPPTKTWKQAERRVSDLFGTTRRALSGGNSKSGGRDDAHHPRLFLEVKYRKEHAMWKLWQQCRDFAAKELRRAKRRPIIALSQKGKQGSLLVVHQDDLLFAALEVLEVIVRKPDFPFSLNDADRFLREFRKMVNEL